MKDEKKGEYVVLARKYRPQGFSEVLGQAAAAVTLKNALAAKRLAHAYLFTGPRGVGKTTMARILAKALNCEKGMGPEPCGTCAACREIAASSSLDVLEMDAASHTGVDNVRQVIIETVALACSRDRYKVFIIDEAHMLSTAAFNALLKTLEEPPPHVVFILATTEAAKVPATIASRCQRFRFRLISADVLAGHLAGLAKKEKIDIEPAALDLLVRAAEGSLRDAVSLLDQCHSFSARRITEGVVREMFGYVPQEMLSGIVRALVDRDARGLAEWLKRVYEQGVEPAQLLRDLRSLLEEAYLERLGLPGASGRAAAPGASSSTETLAYLLRRLNKTMEELRFGDSPRLSLELGLFGCLEAAADLSEWVRRLESLERRSVAGGAVPAPDPGRAPGPREVSAGADETPQAAPQAHPAAEPGASAGSDTGELWGQLKAVLAKERAALAASLERARLEGSQGSWRIVFGRSFDLEQAKRQAGLIEAKLATITGGSVRLSLELGAKPPAPEEAVEGSWQDLAQSPAPSAPSTAALKKAQEILGGKVRIIKKPAW